MVLLRNLLSEYQELVRKGDLPGGFSTQTVFRSETRPITSVRPGPGGRLLTHVMKAESGHRVGAKDDSLGLPIEHRRELGSKGQCCDLWRSEWFYTRFPLPNWSGAGRVVDET